MRIFDHQTSCPNCGKKAKKHTRHYWSTDPYQGNLQVIRDKSYTQRSSHGAYKLEPVTVYDLTLWDGESYEMYCGYFCTNKCAQEFGNGAYRAGYRRG